MIARIVFPYDSGSRIWSNGYIYTYLPSLTTDPSRLVAIATHARRYSEEAKATLHSVEATMAANSYDDNYDDDDNDDDDDDNDDDHDNDHHDNDDK